MLDDCCWALDVDENDEEAEGVRREKSVGCGGNIYEDAAGWHKVWTVGSALEKPRSTKEAVDEGAVGTLENIIENGG